MLTFSPINARLAETSTAAAHDLTLANKLGAKLGSIKGQVDIEVDTVKGALWSVHSLKVLLQVLAREIRGKGDNLFDAWYLLAT